MARFQIGGQALPDGLAIGHRAHGRVDAQEVDATQEKRDDGASKIVASNQTAQGNVTAIIDRTQEIAQGGASDRIDGAGPGAFKQRTQGPPRGSAPPAPRVASCRSLLATY